MIIKRKRNPNVSSFIRCVNKYPAGTRVILKKPAPQFFLKAGDKGTVYNADHIMRKLFVHFDNGTFAGFSLTDDCLDAEKMSLDDIADDEDTENDESNEKTKNKKTRKEKRFNFYRFIDYLRCAYQGSHVLILLGKSEDLELEDIELLLNLGLHDTFTEEKRFYVSTLNYVNENEIFSDIEICDIETEINIPIGRFGFEYNTFIKENKKDLFNVYLENKDYIDKAMDEIISSQLYIN